MRGAQTRSVDVAHVGRELRRWRGAVVACALSLIATTGCTGSASSASGDAPTASGSVQIVEHHGGDAKLSAAIDAAMSDKDGRHGNVRAVLVIHSGRTLVANYYHSVATDHHNIYSITKSVLSTLVGIAVADGHLGLNQTVGQLLPGYRSSMSRLETGITVRQLLTMTAGFPENSSGAFMGAPDWVDFTLSYGLDHRPGTAFAYSDLSAHLLAAVLTRATGQPLLAYARRHLFDPLVIDTRPAFTPKATSGDSLLALDRYTSASSGFAWPTDPQGTYLGFMGIKLTPTDLAKLGELYLHHGRWNGRQVVPGAWVHQATSPHLRLGAGQGYGYLWWSFLNNGHPLYAAIGAQGQLVIVDPHLDLVVVIASDIDGGTANPVSNPQLSDEVLKVVIPALKR